MNIAPSKTVTGFTLIEVLVALFIFSLVMTATMQIFASAYSGYRMTRLVQRDIENAQFAMNALAKMLRTSTVVNAAGGVQYNIRFFDHSQGKCFHYKQSGVLEAASADCDSVALCRGLTLGTYTPVTTGSVGGFFEVTTSTSTASEPVVPTRVGKVTIALSVAQYSPAHNNARLQTSVSLRDFGNIGL